METKPLTVRWLCIGLGSSRFSKDTLNDSHSLCANIHILLLLLLFLFFYYHYYYYKQSNTTHSEKTSVTSIRKISGLKSILKGTPCRDRQLY